MYYTKFARNALTKFYQHLNGWCSNSQYGRYEEGDSTERITKKFTGWTRKLLHPGKIAQGSQGHIKMGIAVDGDCVGKQKGDSLLRTEF